MASRKKYCLIKSCKIFFGTLENIRTFRFPKDRDSANKWKIAIGSNNENIFGNVCIGHFSPDNLIKSANGSITLRNNAVPTLNLMQQEPRDRFEKMQNSPECENCLRLKQNYVNQTQNHQNQVQHLESKVKELQQMLKKQQNHTYFLEKTKSKLNETLGKLRINNREAREMVEVFLQIVFSMFMHIIHVGMRYFQGIA